MRARESASLWRENVIVVVILQRVLVRMLSCSRTHVIRDFKIQRRDSNENVAKSEFAFFQSLSRLCLLTYFVKCTRTLLHLNSKGPYSYSESKIQFRRCLFMFFIKQEMTYFHVVVLSYSCKNGKEMYKKAWCTCKVVVLLIKPVVLLDVPVDVASLNLKDPIKCFRFYGR